MNLFPWKRSKSGSVTISAEKATYVEKVEAGQAFFGIDAPDPAALEAYLVWLRGECAKVPLLGLDVRAADASGPTPMTLDQIYIGLDTMANVRPSEPEASAERNALGVQLGDEQNRPLTALEAIIQNRHVALLGLPGSGKSTFVRHLAYCLAGHALEPEKPWLLRLCIQPAGGAEPVPVWPAQESELVPLTIELRNFAAAFREGVPAQAHSDHLWNYFAASLHAPYDRALPSIRAALEAGQAIVFLDGLDEVPKVQQEKLKLFVRDAVLAFAGSPFGRSRILVTCRTFSYRGQGWRVTGFPDFELKDFDDAKIQGFIRLWYRIQVDRGQIPPADLDGRCRSLWEGLRERNLRLLAGNPVQLTSMAIVDCHHSRLPDSRAKLYDELIKLLLYRWDDIRFGNAEGITRLSVLLQQADCDDKSLLRLLRRLAWQAQEGQRSLAAGTRAEQPTADISEADLLAALRTLHRDDTVALSWAENVLRTIEARSGLLQSPRAQSRVFKFPHRSYQEFLAGAYLADKREEEFLQQAVNLVEDSRYWWEVLRWAAGVQVHVKENLYTALALVAKLRTPSESATPLPLAWRKLLLAGEMLAEMKPASLRTDELGQEQLAKVQVGLVRLLDAGALPVAERAEAGLVLAKLGDPRPGVRLKDGLPDLDWLELPSGEFALGEKSAQNVKVPKFRISRYPVTVAQYQAFVDAGGYAEKRFWDCTKENPQMLKWWEENKAGGPEDYDPVFQTPNHPRVGVCWYEAVAFCRWLSKQLSLEIRLPYEAEWEWAARWNKKTGHADNRTYPWGGRAEANLAQHCNCGRTGLGHTSAVGLFPDGRADCGAMDLSGNVWEWCEDWYDEKRKEYRVLRGGSWISDLPTPLSCSYRGYVRPGNRDRYYGFRCVVVAGLVR